MSLHQDFKINVDSTGLTKTENSNIDFQLLSPIILTPTDPYDIGLSVESLSLPLVYYIINSLNNKIQVNGTIYLIPVGNYNINSIVVDINQLLLAENVKVVYSTITLKLTFSSLNQSNGIIFGNQSTAQAPLGFTVGSKTLPYQSDHSLNLIYSNTVSVVLNGIETINQTIKGASRNNSTLLRLPLNVPVGNIFVYHNVEPNSSTTVINRIITRLNIDLQDDYGDSIPLPNASYFITLRIRFIRRQNKDETDNIMKKVRLGDYKAPDKLD